MEKKQFLFVVFDMCLVKTQAESKDELLKTINEMLPAEADFEAHAEIYEISETSPEKVYELVEKYTFMSCTDFSEVAERITLIADLFRLKKGGR